MNNVVNYLNHVITEPEPVNLRFDSPEFPVDKEAPLKDRISRVAQMALPILSLYQPFAQPISIVSGVNRVFIHMSLAIGAAKDKKFLDFSLEIFQVALGVFLVTATFFEFKIGILIGNAHDVIMGIVHIVQHLMDKEYSLAAKEALQVIASALYITFMVTGTLEYLLAMLLLQVVISIYQARDEIANKHFLEAALCVITSLIRMYQAYNCYVQIETRNFLQSIQKCQELFNRVFKAKAAHELLQNDLIDIEGNIIEKGIKMKDADGKEYDFGAHFHAYGKELVKGANLEFKKVTVGDETHYEIDFKVNAIFRREIQKVLEDYVAMEKGQIKAVLKAAHSKASDIIVQDGSFKVGHKTVGESNEIVLKGLGKVILGGTDDYPGLKDHVTIKMDSSKNLFDLHEILCLTNMEKAIQTSSQSDLDRLKMGHLYRVFCPKQATPFERTEEYYSLSVDQLKQKIILQAPEMEKIFETYFDKMEQAEILPGKVRYQISGLAEEVRKEGGLFLTAALTGAYTEQDLFKRVHTILNMGMLSNETRSFHGINSKGLSSKADFGTGGADSVFTQMYTEGHQRQGYTLDSFAYYSDIRVIIGLEALETGTYQYHGDQFGIRRRESPYYWWPAAYLQRPGITEFVKEQAAWPNSYHEVMLKERVAPEYIQGLQVRSQSMKTNLVSYLRTANLVQNAHGIDTINGVPVDTFIKVAA